MELSLKNYTSVLPKELLKLAEKNKVRECDETEKGHFVAYVDEGDDTYDVSLTVSPKAEVTEHTCDCKNGKSFCRHKAALLMHIAGNTGVKKTKQAVKAKQKISKADALLDEADEKALKTWVRELLSKNKDIEMAFIHYFSAAQHGYTKEEITRLTVDAVKAVVKNRIKIETTELKKIVDLFASIHAPVVKQYHENLADEKLFLNFHELINTCAGFNLKTTAGSNKIYKYIEDLLQNTIEPLNNLYDENAWDTAIGFFIKHIPYDKHEVRLYYAAHLKNLAAISSQTRKMKLIDLLVKQYSRIFTQNMSNGISYTRIIFSLVDEHKLFDKYITVFKPIRYQNEYNLKLIELLADNKEWKFAEKYCLEQISNNARDEYDVPYLALLKLIYTLTKNENSLAPVLEKLLPYTWNFEDFMFLNNRITHDDERKKWRAKILDKAKRAGRGKAIDFCFQLADHEKKYTKMFEYMHRCSYENILRYFEPLAQTDKALLLKAILDKTDDYFYSGSDARNAEAEIFPQLLAALLRIYTPEYLIAAVKKAESNTWHINRNRFIIYSKENLLEKK